MKVLALTFALFLFAVSNSRAQENDSNHNNVNPSGVLLNGYDVVSYFLGEVQKGKSTITVNHEGVEFWFSNKENKAFFIKNPEKFIPAYGGWCAYAMGETGKKVKIDPKTYKIIDGKLYLFYNFYFNNTLIDWNEDQVELKQQADANWQKYFNE